MDRGLWVGELRDELLHNILPFWRMHVFDGDNGGLIGAMTHDGRLLDVPRSTVLAARVLWTFASVGGKFPYERGLLDDAGCAFRILRDRYWDPTHGGFVWSVDKTGKPVDGRKHSYANAFAIYGLVAYSRAAGSPEALELAMEVFRLLQTHAWDPEHDGYVEGCAPDWGSLDNFRLSEKEPNVPKSMNTHLHVLEALTELLRATGDPEVREAHHRTLQICLERIVDPVSGHFHLFFRNDWTVIPSDVSYGHDIEGAWLMRRAAKVDGAPELIAKADQAGIRLAERTLAVGISEQGACYNAGTPQEATDRSIHWWPQAEAMVGFMDIWQLTGDKRYRDAAYRVWRFAMENLADHDDGDWRKSHTADLKLLPKSCRIGPWECPYHHARACLEGIARLSAP